jgi:tRNA G46 methylase TrmB
MADLSKAITNYNLTSKEKIFKILEKYQLDLIKPVAKNIPKIIDEIKKINKPLIIDAFCGVGESTYHHAQSFPDFHIIGFDKSLDRLDRKNAFKKDMPKNMSLYQADILDLYPLLYEIKDQIKIKKQFFLYPNPWPKSKNKKKRIYLNNIIPYVFKLSDEIEFRSNWGRFIVEASMACEFYNFNYEITKIEVTDPITPFERKYSASGQSVFGLVVKRR